LPGTIVDAWLAEPISKPVPQPGGFESLLPDWRLKVSDFTEAVSSGTTWPDQRPSSIHHGPSGQSFSFFVSTWQEWRGLEFVGCAPLLPPSIPIWSTLSHPYILPFLGFLHALEIAALGSDASPCFVMLTSSVEDACLADLLRDGSEKLTPTLRVEIAISVALALGYLHSRGIVHGCVRPSQIFFDSSMRP
jgi:hypothetical protein